VRSPAIFPIVPIFVAGHVSTYGRRRRRHRRYRHRCGRRLLELKEE